MTKLYNIIDFFLIEKTIKSKRKVYLPSRKTFEYIYKKAKNGNEMAVAQIFEWAKFCTPKTHSEEQVFEFINCAFDELFNRKKSSKNSK